jgi:signal transduction histidine kinase/DNA-binding response OmpR family regulator/ligand-binding sensor domain-containing protein
VFLLASLPASAQQRAPYRIDRWTTDDGLPSHSVSDLVQTADGYLWIATAGGLVRFDGRSFETFTASPNGLPSARISGLAAGAGDTLWITTEDGHLVRYAERRFSVLTGPGAPLLDVEQDAEGRVWVSRSPGLWRLDGDSLVLVHDIDVFFMTRSFTPVGPQFVRTAAGDFWVREDAVQRMLRVAGGRLQPGPGATHRAVIVQPSRGAVLFARSRGEYAEVFNEAGRVVGAFVDGEDAVPRLVDRRGHLWVTRDTSIEVYAGAGGHLLAGLPLQTGERIGVMIEDVEGNIWASTGAHGLIRVQPLLFRVFARADGFREDQVMSLSRGRDGTVLAVDRRWNVYRISRAGVELVFEEGSDAAMEHAWGAYEDARGTLWLGRGGGLPRRHFIEGRPARGPPIDLELPSRALVTQFAEDPTEPGTFWFADRRVYRARPYDAAPALLEVHLRDGVRAVRHIVPARDSTVWVATSDGLGRISRGSIHFYGRVDGLPVDHIRAVHEDGEGRIWVGTYGGGISVFDGSRFHAIRQTDGLIEDVVSFILEDDVGNFWMSGNRGVHRVPRADLLDFVAGRRPRVRGVGYGRNAGIPNPETSGWHAYRSPDGHLWFPTYEGVVVVDPAEALARDTIAPRVHIELLRLRDRTLHPAAELRLEASERRVEFVYAGISLGDPTGVRYDYRLEPLDREWIAAGDAQSTVYTNLRPGRYTFHVRATGGGGAAADAAPLTFVVPARFYESSISYLFGLLGLLGLGFAAYRLRIRRMRVREQALRRIVEERTRELAEEKERAENASATVIMQSEQLRLLDEAKTRFFTNASHELRTPLTLILAPLQDLEDGRAGALPAAARERITVARRSGAQLGRLVDQLLNAARLEAGTLRIDAADGDIVAFLRDAARGFELLAPQQGLEFVQQLPPGPVMCRFDPAQLTIVLLNLLGNAFKFTPRGGCVALHARLEAPLTDAAELVIDVVDTGPGIAPVHLPHVFERYYQVQAPELTGPGGLGLGLALTRELVELHGGHITLGSSEGVGSTFTVRLPLAGPAMESLPERDPVSTPAAAAVPPQPIHASPLADAPFPDPREDVPTVLLVEDNEELRAWIRDRLIHAYRVLEAADGAAGLELARSVVPDVIISDVMMPVMDGEALCRAVRADSEIAFIPIILLTARASQEARVAGLEGGADDYLAKPFDVRELLARVHNTIASRQRLRERLQAAATRTPAPRPPETHGDAAARALLQRVYAHLADNIADEDFSIDRLAAAMAMSRATLYRRLQPLIDVSPMELIWRYRLEQAALWLNSTDANISEIAYGVGFKSVPHFCTRFREQYGTSPSAWRARVETPA